MARTTAVILAAGEGKRMKSDYPKVLHKVCGYSMLSHVVKAAKRVASDVVVVVGHRGEQVKAAFTGVVQFVEQKEQLGTAHAVMQAQPLLPADGTVLILCGDTPLLSGDVIEDFYAAHQKSGAAATILTALVPHPFGFGRIVRDADGCVQKIVEEKDALATERMVNEINTGTYLFTTDALCNALAKVGCANVQGEYYLTDCIELLLKDSRHVTTHILADYKMALGVNDRLQLAEAQRYMQNTINRELMAAGVTLLDPQTVYVDAGVVVGKDTIIMPNTIIKGKTVISEGCKIGPNTEIRDTIIGSRTLIRHSVIASCIIEDNVSVGPFAHLRPQTVLKNGVHVGDFVEIKKSFVGNHTKIAHLSYIGDAEIGCGVNMGAGTIVVNYDGQKKHKTLIKDRAFVGCNSNLIAPVTIGKGAFVAAGSTITKDVPDGSLSLARARQVDKAGLATRFLHNNNDET